MSWQGLNPGHRLERPIIDFFRKKVGEKTSIDEIIEYFQGMLKIELDLAEKTVKQHVSNIEEFLKFIKKTPKNITKKDISKWLKKYEENYSKSTRPTRLKA